MGTVLRFSPNKRRARVRRESGSGQVLLFTGIRYTRSPQPHPVEAPVRRRKRKV